MKSIVTILIALLLGITITLTARESATTLPSGNIAHGRYLAEHVAMCIECHSRRDAQGTIIESEIAFLRSLS